jgi:hypothetical protein
MNKAHSVSTHQPTPRVLDPAEAERAGRMLDRLAEMAMEQAEATHQGLLADTRAGDAAQAKDFGLAFDRAARGLRRTLALKFRLVRDRQEMADKAAAQARDRAAETARRRRQVAGLVTRSIAADGNLYGADLEKATSGMWERLIEDDGVDAALVLAGHPIEEIVIRLCRDIGIRPELVLADPDRPAEDQPTGPYAAFPTMDVLMQGDEPKAPWWPIMGPGSGRYQRFQAAKDGRPDGAPYWWDTVTKTRLDRPPWKLKPDGSG